MMSESMLALLMILGRDDWRTCVWYFGKPWLHIMLELWKGKQDD